MFCDICIYIYICVDRVWYLMQHNLNSNSNVRLLNDFRDLIFIKSNLRHFETFKGCADTLNISHYLIVIRIVSPDSCYSFTSGVSQQSDLAPLTCDKADLTGGGPSPAPLLPQWCPECPVLCCPHHTFCG